MKEKKSSKRRDFGPTIEGIELPQAIYFPPELVPLIPSMSLAELKVTIIAVAEEMRIGGSEPISFTQFEERSGLSRPSVSQGIKDAITRGTLVRTAVEGYQGHVQFMYELNFKVKSFIGKNSLPMDGESKLSSESYIEENEDSLLTTKDSSVKNVYMMLKKLGVYHRKAQAIVEIFPVGYIMRYIKAYQKARFFGKANTPGWLSNAIEQAWDITELEALEFHDGGEEDRSRYVGGEYGDLINH